MNLLVRLLLLRLRVRRRPTLSIWDRASTPMRVTLTDLDLLGHVNNGKYLSMLDLGRMDLLLRSGFWAAARGAGWVPVVAAQTISYRRSLTLGQRFEVLTRVLGTHGNSVFLEQRFVRGETLCAHAIIRTRFLRDGGGTVSGAEIDALSGEPPADRADESIPEWVLAWAEESRLPRDEQ